MYRWLRNHARIGAVLPLLGACSVEAELEGKRCPCLDEFDCDPATKTCVASASATPNPSTLLAITEFSAEWATPNQLAWRWFTEGQKDDFVRYEISLAPSESELIKGGGTTYGPDENPELGGFTLPRTGGPEDFVRATITDQLSANTEYVARLVAFDRLGAVAISSTALAKTTLEPLFDVTLFNDIAPPWTIPACLGLSSTQPHTGSQSLEYTVSCSADGTENLCGPTERPACWTSNALGFTADFAGMTPGTFADAFVEAAFAIDGDAHVYWGAILMTGQSVGGFGYQPITLRAGGAYRVYQVPLSRLGSTPVLSVDVLTNGELDSFAVAGELPAGSHVRLDAVRVRW